MEQHIDCAPLRRTLCYWSAIGAIAAACGQSSAGDGPRFVHEANRACFTDSESDRWTPGRSQRITSIELDPDAGFEFGIAGSDQWLFLFDQQLGRIVVADSLDRQAHTFARPGHGPGEILPGRAPSQLVPMGRGADWVDVSGDTVALLDGLTIHWYRPDGTLIRDEKRGVARVAQNAMVPLSTRLRRFGSHDLIDIEPFGRRNADGTISTVQRVFSIWSVGDTDAEMVFELRMADFPLRRGGTPASPFRGVEEARAFWDLHAECLVVTDGGSPRLYVQRVGSHDVDTLGIPLPEAMRHSTGEQEELMSKLGSSGPIPEPAVRKRVRRFVIDPDGWAWIEPNHRDPTLPEIHVLRVHLASGRAHMARVPVFPRAFRPDGGFVGVQRVRETGQMRLLRIRKDS
jgi:hypothetical protein